MIDTPPPGMALIRGTLDRPADLFQRPWLARKGQVARRALVERLRCSTDARVVLVVAAPGFGKTTLLGQWAANDERPFAWLTLREAHNDASALAGDLARVLRPTEPVEWAAPRNGDPAPTTPLSRLGSAVVTSRHPLVLVLDDVHVLRTPASMTALATIAAHLPPGSQVAMAGRREPSLPLARWSLQGDLLRVGSADLAMTRDEAQALLRIAGVDLPLGELEVLLQRTEGWPAGLSFAALALVDQPDRARAVAGFAGDDRLVATYLQDEVLGQLAPELVRFLTLTSVLDRLSGPLCDAVVGGQGSGALLRDLERSNQLMVPLDRRQQWYRCHRLLTDILRADLHRQDPALEVELNRRASAWYEASQEPGQAIRHLWAAGDVARAAGLVLANVLDDHGRGRVESAQRRLDEFTEAQVAAQPALALSAAWCAAERGDVAAVNRWTAATELGSDGGAIGGPLEAGVSILRAVVGGRGLSRMGDDAAYGCRVAAAGSPWLCVGRLMEGVSWRLRGDLGRARTSLEACERLATATPAPAILAQCLAQLALVSIEEDDWEYGEMHVTRAEAQLGRHGLRDPATAIPVHAATSLVLARLGQAGDARVHIRRAARHLAGLGEARPWLAVDARIVLAQASLLLADASGALDLLTEARRRLGRAADIGALGARLETTWQRAHAFWQSGVVAPSPLSKAELRILRLLPTHFSYREIGERLHVSQCTVKSQALSVYRKLEVRSRSEAVERASALGLIPC